MGTELEVLPIVISQGFLITDHIIVLQDLMQSTTPLGLSKKRFLCVALVVLELTLLTRIALNSEIHLSLPPECWD